ncbi:hypothetical protein FNO01nite_20510 [Flavobacterium noncentrifugens]|uniref:AsmA family protein n=1 Tax=Flavobacterium noncentrifugens TaxID=1128970 RepID=A0A1G8YVT1_9FLAO|nr:AsmA-like C-terminal region-containing protein [Flavobacterium noncentrifugens]GEP51379.1 hypothetical protein FNO01nite_20510 [Flavobacterium noncentrifugens]SDK06928.1 AsmA family protein [Flavobacterium noncentrifugens]
MIPEKTSRIRKVIRRILQVFGILIVLIFAAYAGMAWYINAHKKEMLQSLTTELNKNINGSLTIGDMEPAFLRSLPRLSLNLKNVTIRDSLYEKHKHTFLQAEDFYIAVNALALLHGTIEIKKIDIKNASVDLFTDKNGYSNSNVFKKSGTKKNGESGALPELKKFSLDHVDFAIDNQSKKKLFHFNIDDLDGDLDYTPEGFNAKLNLNTLVKSMAFSTDRGSFLKDKIVEGKFDIVYTKDSIAVLPNQLEIGGEDFVVSAGFQLEKSADFEIHIKNEKILWKNASRLLAPNISSRLDLFDLKEPIFVTCDIVGDFNDFGDPLIHVKAKIRDNMLTTSGGMIDNCSFDGEFTNHNIADKGFDDANSAVKIFNFKGDYAGMPILMQQTLILNFDKPIAVGDFSSEFEIGKLNNIIDKDLLGFSKGTAVVKVNYEADIVNYELAKPKLEGTIQIKNADVKYAPRNLDFNDISVILNFKDEDLSISNIHLRSGKSIVNMEGSIRNFLNLYYTAPEKIVVDWKVKSPQLHLGEFMGFVSTRKKVKSVKKKSTRANFTEDLNKLFDNINVNMTMNVDKLFYDRFYATNVTASLFLNDSGIQLKNAGLRHADGNLKLSGTLSQQGKINPFQMNAVVTNVNISKFFYAFDNFGLQSLQAKNLNGYLSANTNISGKITDQGGVVPKSMIGKVDFGLKKVKLLQFSPIKSIGKFAFPFRDFDTISFYNLKGDFDISGEKVTISPMQINSSILNMDVEGVYSFGKGTNIYVTVPLRNPKKDKDITDADELAKRRNRGIMLRLIAADGDDGKVKVSLGRKQKQD